MCAFHHSLQTGSLFEREGRWDRGYAFHGWQFHLCRGRKIQKFRSFSIEELGEVGKVVLTRLVTRKAIGMRFEEGWSWFLVWKRLGKRKISCFWGGHRLWCTCFWKFMKALKGSDKDSARPVWKTGDEEWVYRNTRRMTQGSAVYSFIQTIFARKWQNWNSTRNIIKITIKRGTK